MSIIARCHQSLLSTLRFVATILAYDEIHERKLNLRIININTKFSSLAARSFSSPAKPTESRNLNEPNKFVGSAAASWTSKQGRMGSVDYEKIPWFQMYAVVGSVAIFLIYFCILREENDIDLELEKSLYDRVPGLEQTQLILNFKFNLENDNDNSAIEARMKELGMRPEDIKL